MMLFKVQKNNIPEMKEAYGNYYALPVILQTMGNAELAVMMAEHNTGFSAGQVKGMLTDLVRQGRGGLSLFFARSKDCAHIRSSASRRTPHTGRDTCVSEN